MPRGRAAASSSPKAPPSGPEWLHEIKHDGFRILALRDACKLGCDGIALSGSVREKYNCNAMLQRNL